MTVDKYFSTIEESLEAFKNGEMIIVLDDEARENEGDFIMAAEKVTDQDINFMATIGRGLICAPISKSIADKLSLDLMVNNNDSNYQTAFTVSIDVDNGSTGISSQDRAETFLRLAAKDALPEDFVRPGHVFPLIAKDGGVLEREGHTEASVDLCRLTGLNEVAVICEIMNPDGTMARRDDLIELSKIHNLKIMTIKDLIEYRKINQ